MAEGPVQAGPHHVVRASYKLVMNGLGWSEKRCVMLVRAPGAGSPCEHPYFRRMPRDVSPVGSGFIATSALVRARVDGAPAFRRTDATWRRTSRFRRPGTMLGKATGRSKHVYGGSGEYWLLLSPAALGLVKWHSPAAGANSALVACRPDGASRWFTGARFGGQVLNKQTGPRYRG